MRNSPTARAARYTIRKGYLHLLTTQIHERLTERYRLINTEIHSYPGPIANCDLHLTHLLDERQRLMKALGEWPGDAACTLPIVGTMAAVNGLNTLTGIVSIEATVEALETVYADSTVRDALGKKGLAKANEPQFRWEYVAQRFDEILRKVIAQPKGQ